MADDLSKKGFQDRTRINLSEPYEMDYWAGRFGVSKELLGETINKVGNSVSAVEQELKG